MIIMNQGLKQSTLTENLSHENVIKIYSNLVVLCSFIIFVSVDSCYFLEPTFPDFSFHPTGRQDLDPTRLLLHRYLGNRVRGHMTEWQHILHHRLSLDLALDSHTSIDLWPLFLHLDFLSMVLEPRRAHIGGSTGGAATGGGGYLLMV